MMTRIYSALYQDDAHLGKYGMVQTVRHPSELTETNAILILHGGSDISPSIYKHKVSKYTHAGKTLSTRDTSEVHLAKRAIELGIPIFGICRGAQLACALAGGSLIQHVTNHVSGSHEVVTNKQKSYITTSCHHQMMNPAGTNHELLAVATPSRSDCYIVENEAELNVEQEPELIYFNDIKALAVQGHPEWMEEKSPYVKYLLSTIEEKFHDVL